jgi:hypothetical protein
MHLGIVIGFIVIIWVMVWDSGKHDASGSGSLATGVLGAISCVGVIVGEIVATILDLGLIMSLLAALIGIVAVWLFILLSK